MIGIIGAMTIEIDGIKLAMTDVAVKKIGGMEFICGTFWAVVLLPPFAARERSMPQCVLRR